MTGDYYMAHDLSEYINELKKIDKQHCDVEDKNYYLFHKYVDISNKLGKNELKQLRDLTTKTFCGLDYNVFLDYIMFVDGKTEYPMKEIENTGRTGYHLNIIDFYDGYDENLLLFLKGCLFIENCLNRILIKKEEKSDTTLFNKINKIYDLGLITEKTKDLLMDIKDIRNNIAHNLFYQLSFNEIFDLVKKSVDAGVIYSDDSIWENRKLSYEFYGIGGILNELFPNTFAMLLDDNSQLFSNDEYCDLLS